MGRRFINPIDEISSLQCRLALSALPAAHSASWNRSASEGIRLRYFFHTDRRQSSSPRRPLRRRRPAHLAWSANGLLAGPQPTTTCVVAPTRAIRDTAERVFRGKGMSTQVVEANKKDTSAASAVRFSTMHRAKGLEFDQVLVLTPDRFLGPPAETADERRLLYVAMTRAKRAAALIAF
jgi:superfamily I DNA/RNA helicase